MYLILSNIRTEFFLCRNEILHSVSPVPEYDKIPNVVTSPLPKQGDPIQNRNAAVTDSDVRCRKADAGGIISDADAPLWLTIRSSIVYFRLVLE